MFPMWTTLLLTPFPPLIVSSMRVRRAGYHVLLVSWQNLHKLHPEPIGYTQEHNYSIFIYFWRICRDPKSRLFFEFLWSWKPSKFRFLFATAPVREAFQRKIWTREKLGEERIGEIFNFFDRLDSSFWMIFLETDPVLQDPIVPKPLTEKPEKCLERRTVKGCIKMPGEF